MSVPAIRLAAPPKFAPPPPAPSLGLTDPTAAYAGLPIPGSLKRFKWGRKTYGPADKAKFRNYLEQRGINFASWAGKNPRLAKVFTGPSVYDIANAAATAAVKPTLASLDAEMAEAEIAAKRRTQANQNFNLALTSLLGRQVPGLADTAGEAAATQAALAKGLGNAAVEQQAGTAAAGGEWLTNVAGAPAENVNTFLDALTGREATTYGVGGYIPSEELRQTYMGAAREAAQRAYGGGGVPSVPVALKAAEQAQIRTQLADAERDIRAKRLQARLTGAANVPTVISQIQQAQQANQAAKLNAYNARLQGWQAGQTAKLNRWSQAQNAGINAYQAQTGRMGAVTAQESLENTIRATNANIKLIGQNIAESRTDQRIKLAGVLGVDPATGLPTVDAKKLAETIRTNNITIKANEEKAANAAIQNWATAVGALASDPNRAKIPNSKLRMTAYTMALSYGIPNYIAGGNTRKWLNGMIDGILSGRVPPSAAKGGKTPKTVADLRDQAIEMATGDFGRYTGEPNDFGEITPNKAYSYMDTYQKLLAQYGPILKKRGMKRREILIWIEEIMRASGYSSPAGQPGGTDGAGATTSGAPPAGGVAIHP